MKKHLLVLLAMCVALSFTACRSPTNNATGSQTLESTPAVASASMDAGAIVEAYGAHRNVPQVQGKGIVVKVLKDDTKGLQHQKFLLKDK